MVDTSDKGFRQRFARIAAQREADLRAALAHAGVDTLELSTRRRPGGRRRALRRPAPPAHAPGHGRRLAAPPAPGGLSKPTKDRKD
jgi:hypothetical protein